MDQLYEEAIYISIGGREFRIHKNLFSCPGDSPNYFTLGYAFLFTSPGEAFPGLNRDGLLRPPSIMPPAIPNHSADIFADLVHVLQGYPLHIRNETHRKELLQDCKYFLFKGVEQKLIPHHISYNSSRMRSEIILRLEDLRQTGLSFAPDQPLVQSRNGAAAGWVRYARPFVDNQPYELIVEISNECMKLNTSTMRAELFGDEKKRIMRLLEVVAQKLSLPMTDAPRGATDLIAGDQSNDGTLRFAFDQASCVLDGRKFTRPADLAYEEDFEGEGTVLADEPLSKRRRTGSTSFMKLLSNNGEIMPMVWTVRTGQWRLKIVGGAGTKGWIECVLVAVKIDAVSGEPRRNEMRGFLSG